MPSLLAANLGSKLRGLDRPPIAADELAKQTREAKQEMPELPDNNDESLAQVQDRRRGEENDPKEETVRFN